jgi:hypothetical protein
MKKIVLSLLVVLFVAGTGFRPISRDMHCQGKPGLLFLDMYYQGGSGPQIVATYYGNYIIVDGTGTSGIIRIDYNAGGWLYRDIVTPGSPYYIPSNTSTITLSTQTSTSLYSIY